MQGWLEEVPEDGFPVFVAEVLSGAATSTWGALLEEITYGWPDLQSWSL
ncbi:MAG: hypothetical protein AB1425_00025 [Actinomycetota bacterium]